MALFRIKNTEVTVCYMDIEADSEEEAEEFLEIEKEYRRGYIRSLLTTEEIDETIMPISCKEAQGFVHAPHEEVKQELDWFREQWLAKQKTMKQQYDQYMECRITSMDMIRHEDIYWCLFRLLMQRQAEEYGNDSQESVSTQLAAELTKIDQTRRSFEVAVLFELTLWLRENQYHWYCSPAMKNSILLYLLGITKIKPKRQRPSVWTGADPTFEIAVQDEAFDKLEELFECHWFTQVCNQHYEIGRNDSKTAKYGYIIITKNGFIDKGECLDE